jgi:hypothetical protein
LEEEIECLQKERDHLGQERARALEGERKVGEELKARNRELTGRIRFDFYDHKVFIDIACC